MRFLFCLLLLVPAQSFALECGNRAYQRVEEVCRDREGIITWLEMQQDFRDRLAQLNRPPPPGQIDKFSHYILRQGYDPQRQQCMLICGVP